jgi:hypothetical protein
MTEEIPGGDRAQVNKPRKQGVNGVIGGKGIRIDDGASSQFLWCPLRHIIIFVTSSPRNERLVGNRAATRTCCENAMDLANVTADQCACYVQDEIA